MDTIAQEEIFGPVLSVIPVPDYPAAVTALNQTRYGLSSSIFTRDANTAFRAMRDFETGIVYVNAGTIGAETHLPFGGHQGDRQRPSRGRPRRARHLHRVEGDLHRLQRPAPASPDRQPAGLIEPTAGMRSIRLVAVLVLAAFVWGCAGSSATPAASEPTSAAASSDSVRPSPAPATEGPSTAPSPTIGATPRPWASDPLTATAGADFSAAAERVNAAVDVAYRTYPVFNVRDLAGGRAFFRAASAAERAFVTAVKGIDFPAGMETDVQELLDAEAALIELEDRAVQAKTLEALDALLRDYIAISASAADASTVVRRDLGLPVGAS